VSVQGEQVANETILIIDADTKSQKVLEVNFKRAGYRVMITETMAQAKELLAAKAPDLIITDTKLPDGDGFLLCEHIKQQPLLRDVPLIFLTEDGSLQRKMRGLELGATDYLTKPIYIKEIVGRVELALQQRAKSMLTDADAEQIEGDLSEITMVDLLQTIEVELRSGTIQLNRNGIQAMVYFQDGNILDAICGKLQGEEALYRLMLWPKGKFVVRYHEVVKRADVIEKDSTTLLLEGMRRLERWNEIVVTLPHLSRVFEPHNKRFAQVADALPLEVTRLIRLFDGNRTLRDVIDDSPVDDLTTLHILRRLLEDEILQDVTPEDRSPSATAQHTNLATWLASRPELSTERSGSRNVGRTAPGLPSQADADSESQVAQAQAVGLGAPVSEPLEARGEEEGMVPSGHQQEGKSWSFHWDPPQAEAPSMDPAEALRLFEEQETRRREEEARQLAAQQIEEAPEPEPEAAGLLPEPGPESLNKLDIWMRGGAQRSVSEEEAAPGDDVYVPREPTQEMHRNAMLAQIAAHDEERERANTPHAMPAQVPKEPRRPTPRDPYEGIEDMLASRLAAPTAAQVEAAESATPVEEALEEAEAIQREAAEQLQQHGQVEAAEGERRRTTDQFAAIRLEQVAVPVEPAPEVQPATPAPLDLVEVPAPLIALGSPEDEASEPTVEPAAQQAPPASSGADAFQEEGDEDEEEEDEEDEEDEETPAVAAEPGAPKSSPSSSVELRAVRENKDIPLPHRTARDHELIRTEYDLTKRKTQPPREKAEVEAAVAAEVSAAKVGAQPEAAKGSQDDKTTARLGAVKPSDAMHVKPAAQEPATKPAVEEPAANADVSAQVPIDPLMAEPPVLKRRDDPMDDLLAVDPQSGFNFKGLLAVSVVIVVVLITLGVLYNNKPKQDLRPPVAPEAPDAGVVAQAPDLAQLDLAPAVPEAPALDAPAASAAASDYGKAVVLVGARLVLLHSGIDPDSVADPLNPAAQADMGAVVEADMAPDQAVAVVDIPAEAPDQGAAPVDKPSVDKPPVDRPTFDEQLVQAERLVRNESMAKARKILADLNKEQPDNAKVIYLLGRTDVGSNNDRAIKQLIQAKLKGYDDPELYAHLGIAYQISGDTDKARKNYEEYLKRSPSGKMAKEIRAVLSSM
jgi:DNA-binding response OmpR family regulator